MGRGEQNSRQKDQEPQSPNLVRFFMLEHCMEMCEKTVATYGFVVSKPFAGAIFDLLYDVTDHRPERTLFDLGGSFASSPETATIGSVDTAPSAAAVSRDRLAADIKNILETQKAQVETQKAQVETQKKAQLEVQKILLETQKPQVEIQKKAQLEMQKAQLEMQQTQLEDL
jgi:hypothetical protein